MGEQVHFGVGTCCSRRYASTCPCPSQRAREIPDRARDSRHARQPSPPSYHTRAAVHSTRPGYGLLELHREARPSASRSRPRPSSATSERGRLRRVQRDLAAPRTGRRSRRQFRLLRTERRMTRSTPRRHRHPVGVTKMWLAAMLAWTITWARDGFPEPKTKALVVATKGPKA